MVVSDDHGGLKTAIFRHFQGASWQRCQVHYARSLLGMVGAKKREEFAADLRGVFAALAQEQAFGLASAVAEKLGPGLIPGAPVGIEMARARGCHSIRSLRPRGGAGAFGCEKHRIYHLYSNMLRPTLGHRRDEPLPRLGSPSLARYSSGGVDCSGHETQGADRWAGGRRSWRRR